jgi:hypothetical protein
MRTAEADMRLDTRPAFLAGQAGVPRSVKPVTFIAAGPSALVTWMSSVLGPAMNPPVMEKGCATL